MRIRRLKIRRVKCSLVCLLIMFIVLGGAQPSIVRAQEPNPQAAAPVAVVQWAKSTGWVSPQPTLPPTKASLNEPVQPLVQWAKPDYTFVPSQSPQGHSYFLSPSLPPAVIGTSQLEQQLRDVEFRLAEQKIRFDQAVHFRVGQQSRLSQIIENIRGSKIRLAEQVRRDRERLYEVGQQLRLRDAELRSAQVAHSQLAQQYSQPYLSVEHLLNTAHKEALQVVRENAYVDQMGKYALKMWLDLSVPEKYSPLVWIADKLFLDTPYRTEKPFDYGTISSEIKYNWNPFDIRPGWSEKTITHYDPLIVKYRSNGGSDITTILGPDYAYQFSTTTPLLPNHMPLQSPAPYIPPLPIHMPFDSYYSPAPYISPLPIHIPLPAPYIPPLPIHMPFDSYYSPAPYIPPLPIHIPLPAPYIPPLPIYIPYNP